MPPEAHAILSASSANRWLHCPPSVRLSEGIRDRGSAYATEGTAAHALAEHKLRTALGLPSCDPTEDLSRYDAEMELCTTDYAAYAMELVAAAKASCRDPIVLVEQRLDFSEYVPQGFGTGDCVIIADGTMHIVDFKYGKGVEVSAEGNPQMRCYALGVLSLYDELYDIDSVCMTIYQPRLGNVSSAALSREELLDWANAVLAPTAQLAFEGKGEFACGDWCRFCKAKSQCRARAEENMQLARIEFKSPALLTDEEVSEILGKADALTGWVNDIKDFALQAAISGKQWSGYKLVEGRANRRYTDEVAVAAAVQGAGYDPYERKLLSVTAMTARLGKKQFNSLLGDLTYRPQGKPTLVPESDKRPAMNNAKNDFMEEK